MLVFLLQVGAAGSFWELGNYKRVIKRMESGIESCEIIQSVCLHSHFLGVFE